MHRHAPTQAPCSTAAAAAAAAAPQAAWAPQRQAQQAHRHGRPPAAAPASLAVTRLQRGAKGQQAPGLITLPRAGTSAMAAPQNRLHADRRSCPAVRAGAGAGGLTNVMRFSDGHLRVQCQIHLGNERVAQRERPATKSRARDASGGKQLAEARSRGSEREQWHAWQAAWQARRGAAHEPPCTRMRWASTCCAWPPHRTVSILSTRGSW